MKHLLSIPALLVLAACGTTAATPPDALAPLASSEDCTVIAEALELFDRPHDGSGLAVMEAALLETPSFMTQRAEQRAHGPISLRSCALNEVRLVRQQPAVQLWRPEIHDDRVLVGYRETADDQVIHAVLQRTAEGGWQHVGALVGRPVPTP